MYQKAVYLIVLFAIIDCQENLKCDQKFCDEYILKGGCQTLSNVCILKNNSLGIFLPFPGPCNCCEYCLEYLEENQECDPGDPFSSPPQKICGNGLSCQLNSAKQTTCQPINTDCTQEQRKYDSDRRNGMIGYVKLRPECDEYGMYRPFACIPGETCYCLSENGERIFGDIFYKDFHDDLQCMCSRSYHQVIKEIDPKAHKTQHLRCLSNGNYDTLQCLNSKCFCVNAFDAEPINSGGETVPITNTAALPCFNEELHIEYAHYQECERLFREQLVKIEKFEEEGYEVLDYVLPSCQLDGFYEAVQQNKTGKFCSDPHGNIIENFFVMPNEQLYDSINCKCARARNIIRGDEKPECCGNGNYRQMQCRRGLCRCVDVDGQQVGTEIEHDKRLQLDCSVDSCT